MDLMIKVEILKRGWISIGMNVVCRLPPGWKSKVINRED